MPAEHHRKHPDIHNTWKDWSEDETLHMVAVYNNPCRWETRRRLFNEFRRHIASAPNVRLYVVELAYGDRPHEVTAHDHPDDIQLRTDCEMWHKENLYNVGVRHFPKDWKWGSVCDGDFHLTRHDWALEAIHMMQRHYFVQLFSTYTDLTAKSATSESGHRPYRQNSSFAWNYMHRELFTSAGKGPESSGTGKRTHRGGFPPGATGGIWAFRRDGFDIVGGFPDICILGSGDEHMAYGLAGMENRAAEMKCSSEPYIDAVTKWQRNARRLNQHPGISPIGCVDQHAIHYWHGSKHMRYYADRRFILQRHQFDPTVDLVKDWQGVWRWAGNKPALRDEVRRYFLSRNEDDPTFKSAAERVMV